MGVLHDIFPHTNPLELALSFIVLQGALIYCLFRRLQSDRRVRWALEKKETIAEDRRQGGLRGAAPAGFRRGNRVLPLGVELHRQAMAVVTATTNARTRGLPTC